MAHFTDRTEAGEQLAEALSDKQLGADIVLAIPRGGLPLGRAVADALDVPLDVVVAKKIGAPGNPELAIGAVASDGSALRNERSFQTSGADEEYFERKRTEQAASAREKANQYREDSKEPELAGKTVIVVDDGVATGSTARACLKQVNEADADDVILAVPVGPPDTIDELKQLADEVVCLQIPKQFRAVGAHYERFDQVTDEKAMGYMT